MNTPDSVPPGSNPYVGRPLTGSQRFVETIGKYCGPDDSVISSSKKVLTLPLMYTCTLEYSEANCKKVGETSKQLRGYDGLGKILGVSIEDIRIGKPKDSNLYTVRVVLEDGVVHTQLAVEAGLVHQTLDIPTDDVSHVIAASIRVIGTPSFQLASYAAEEFEAMLGERGHLAEPQLLFTPPAL